MKKVLAIIAMLAIPGVAMAGALKGDCYDCHTMHNSENGQVVAQVFDAATGTVVDFDPSPTGQDAEGIENLLKLDCLACHANNPTAGAMILPLGGGSDIPQVAHGNADPTALTLNDTVVGLNVVELAGGNFSYGLAGGPGTNNTDSKVHNVKELFSAEADYVPANGNPPGMYSDGGVHAGLTSFGYADFTCAGARGCHGTRNQVLNNTTFEKRTGMAAISGAHHVNLDGAKDLLAVNASGVHNGQNVANGYRMIPGLKGYGNTVNRWQNVNSGSHNEYYGVQVAVNGTGCTACHVGGTGSDIDTAMAVPNNSMSGFCATCHGMFHSSGGGDSAENGSSSAFLRHPSDFVIPESGEYAAYNTYDVSAPVARDSVLAGASSAVTGSAGDLVMCLSCHKAHGSANDYILRFDYSTMTAGAGSIPAEAGCLACHTQKGL